jgi:hypothetical protein
VIGETARVEYLAPAGAAGGLPFALDRLQHLYLDPVRAAAGADPWLQPLAAGGCHNDVACYPEWKREARAVAGIGIIGDDSLFCTGQLINDLAGDFTPYFLTANHCVNTAAAASTAENLLVLSVAGVRLSAADAGQRAALLGGDADVGGRGVGLRAAAHRGPRAARCRLGRLDLGARARRDAGGRDPASERRLQAHQLRQEAIDARMRRRGASAHPLDRRADRAGIVGLGRLSHGHAPAARPAPLRTLGLRRESYDQFGAFAATFPHIAGFLARGADDDAAPNQSCAGARLVGPGRFADRVVAYGRPDWYRARVPSGKKLRVTVRFAQQDGVIEAGLITACGRSLKLASGGLRNRRVLELANPGASTTFFWKVELPDDLRNDYVMVVEVL